MAEQIDANFIENAELFSKRLETSAERTSMKIETLRAQLAETDKRRKVLQGRIDKMFVKLPKAVGLASVDDLIVRLLPFASGKLRINGAIRAGAVKATVAAPVTRGRRSRRKGRRYSQAVQDKAKALLTGGKTAAETAGESGASLATINLWKRKWGLVRKRGTSGK